MRTYYRVMEATILRSAHIEDDRPWRVDFLDYEALNPSNKMEPLLPIVDESR